MGRFEIATNKKPFDKEQYNTKERSNLVASRHDLLARSREKTPEYIYHSPTMYQIEEDQIQKEQRGPSRVVSMQWPNGHRTVFPLRNFDIAITKEGEVTFYVTPAEARRIADDIAEAREKLSRG